ncbi:hypothetical protein COP1_008506 [Malus domestica]
MTKTCAIIVCFLLILGLQDGAKSRELEPARNADPLSSSALASLSPAPYHLECISEEQCYEYKCEDPHCIMHCVQATCQCSCGIKYK